MIGFSGVPSTAIARGGVFRPLSLLAPFPTAEIATMAGEFIVDPGQMFPGNERAMITETHFDIIDSFHCLYANFSRALTNPGPVSFSDRLSQWIRRGGHIIIALPDYQATTNPDGPPTPTTFIPALRAWLGLGNLYPDPYAEHIGTFRGLEQLGPSVQADQGFVTTGIPERLPIIEPDEPTRRPLRASMIGGYPRAEAEFSFTVTGSNTEPIIIRLHAAIARTDIVGDGLVTVTTGFHRTSLFMALLATYTRTAIEKPSLAEGHLNDWIRELAVPTSLQPPILQVAHGRPFFADGL